MKKIKALYWKILKHIYAGMAMQGLMTNPKINVIPRKGYSLGEEIAEVSEKAANYLVNKLKEDQA